MGRAVQDEIVEGGLAALGPVSDMMAVESLGGEESGEAASPGFGGSQVHGVRMGGYCGYAARR